ncbi:unnamed protein product [Adineta ricciae]|uniref:Uncharacterized protein n=1 Tax=Adineta ricciae TaxID=249248 RepID=A0A813ZUT7_ADIRI|nr:unnamed protein product [Adineta ricciae]CAF0992721.1 unnamed protein product [Adineta ricciae]
MQALEQVIGSNVILLWLDDHIGRPENCQELKKQFPSSEKLCLFYEVESCVQFVETVKNKKVFAIIQGKYARDIVPCLEQHTSDPVVYIFCMNVLEHKSWAEEHDCILKGGILDPEADLLTRLTQDMADYATSKASEHESKKRAFEELAQYLTREAKRLRAEQCTLMFKTDPYSGQETPCVQPET